MMKKASPVMAAVSSTTTYHEIKGSGEISSLNQLHFKVQAFDVNSSFNNKSEWLEVRTEAEASLAILFINLTSVPTTDFHLLTSSQENYEDGQDSALTIPRRSKAA
jgi:hypothetical protein